MQLASSDRRPGSRLGATSVPSWAHALAKLMDDAIVVPGTGIRIGLDAILGFFLPGVGDALSASSGLVLIVLAFVMRVPGVVLVRMALNVAVDAAIGAIPLVGDAFDAGWKSNRKNVELIERFQRPGEKARGRDYAFVVLSLLIVTLVLLLPLVIVGFVLTKIFGSHVGNTLPKPW